MSDEQVSKVLADIDDYENSAFAMIGLANLYRFDDSAKSFRSDVQFFQGRRFDTSSRNRRTPSSTVTPDLAVLVKGLDAAVAEVKMSLPKDRSLWQRVLEQLERYDDDLMGWPTSDGKVTSHDIVLLVHQMRIALIDVLRAAVASGQVHFDRPLYAVSFIRSTQRDTFLLFRLEMGAPTFAPLRHRLTEPVSVPFEVIAVHYGRFKLWDSRPPIPYLMDLIWREVVADRAASDDRFATLRRNSHLAVRLTVKDTAEYLQENFAFNQSLGGRSSVVAGERQPLIPHSDWVRAAIDAFAVTGLGRWLDDKQEQCEIDYRKENLNVEEFARRYLTTTGGTEEYGGQVAIF
jgi:hypothetical protein